ncbi:heme-binding protein [Mycolicibacter heraklionensis]|uniref:Heme-binding protein n=1 Tax=Mycolicibacter heraklionensis TaxID=512402 RepID=A0A9X7ZGP5_9MYCO|nr:heme-binding protein [Mycolicibacter heraklionensis]QZA08180.1 heme-binding protein [Mycolicibacter heraklionensis]
MSKAHGFTMIRRFGLGVGLLGATAATLVAAPSASAAPDCSPAGVSSTVNSVTGSAQQYLAAHPGANAVVNQAISSPRPQAAADVRSYFTAHPQEYYELRGILAPIGETQRQCQTTGLPPELASAYAEFMAG